MDNLTAPVTLPQEFKILFDKLEEVKSEHSELFILGTGSNALLPESVQEIKRIVEACNEQSALSTFTRA